MRGTWVLLALSACGDPAATPDAGTDVAVASDSATDAPGSQMPLTLAETGLCVDAACTQIASGIVPYTPRWELYSDTATKRRWIYLPPGTQIDTSNMDVWEFPVGTKLWKEFSRGGTRVETRLVWRRGAGEAQNDWVYAAYVWNSAQNDTVWAEFGEQDANGTSHDVPNIFQCRECHEATKPSRVLGFSALQLDTTGASGELDLADLVAANTLTDPPSGSSPYFAFDGGAHSSVYPALSYIHANCGHCHNPNSAITTTQINLRLTVGTVGTPAQTPTYQSTIGVNATLTQGAVVVDAGSPNTSVLISRFESTNPGQRMPKIGVELNDSAAATILRAWVDNLP